MWEIIIINTTVSISTHTMCFPVGGHTPKWCLDLSNLSKKPSAACSGRHTSSQNHYRQPWVKILFPPYTTSPGKDCVCIALYLWNILVSPYLLRNCFFLEYIHLQIPPKMFFLQEAFSSWTDQLRFLIWSIAYPYPLTVASSLHPCFCCSPCRILDYKRLGVGPWLTSPPP